MFQICHRTDKPSFVCAVPIGIEPPDFLCRTWTFEGRTHEIESEQLAFDRPAVHAIARQNGFYLYARLWRRIVHVGKLGQSTSDGSRFRTGEGRMTRTRTSRSPSLPPILPGSWTGDILGGASVNFGQEVQPGPPRQSVEFTYAILPVSLTGPGSSFAWPGVLAIFVPNPLKPDRPDAGTLSSNGALPALHLTLDVTRVQFSDMLPFLDDGRLKEFHFTVEDQRDDGHWPLRSWGMGTRSPEAPQDSPPNR